MGADRQPVRLSGQARAIHEALTMARRRAAAAPRRNPGPRLGARSRRLGLRAARRTSNASRRTIRLMATTAAPELVSVNPATLEPVGSVRRTDPGELPHVVAAARAAQEQWRAAGPSARAEVRAAAEPCVRTPTRSRLDRGRDGEAAHRGDRRRAVHGRRSCALACEARAARCSPTNVSASTSCI